MVQEDHVKTVVIITGLVRPGYVQNASSVGSAANVVRMRSRWKVPCLIGVASVWAYVPSVLATAEVFNASRVWGVRTARLL